MFGSHRATAFAAREHPQSAVTFALCAARGKLSKSDRYGPQAGQRLQPAGPERGDYSGVISTSSGMEDSIRTKAA